MQAEVMSMRVQKLPQLRPLPEITWSIENVLFVPNCISLSVAPWLKQRHWYSFMITLCNVFVVQVKGVQVKGVQGGLRVCNTSWGNSLLFTLQPVLHTLSLYCTPSAYTAHTIYWVIIIVFIGMPCLDTSSMRNKIVCSVEYIYILLGTFFWNTGWYFYESWKYLTSL